MKYIEEFRDRTLIEKLVYEICLQSTNLKGKSIRIMEVCGTHTAAIGKFGIRKILPENIHLLSGPGCPICVTPDTYIDTAIELSRIKGTIVTTFGDMMRVPGSSSSLEKEKAEGRKIEVIYSPLESLDIAERNPGQNVILLGVGFETTVPGVALAIENALQRNIQNFYVLSGHKLIPPAMTALLEDKDTNIDGFLCPGHVSAIIGSYPYRFIPEKYQIPCVIGGFEPVDILQSILMLIKQIVTGEKPCVEIQYNRIVKKQGNRKAMKIIDEVFFKINAEWRGLGVIKESGLAIKKEYSDIDAEKKFPIKVKEGTKNTSCICGDILRGKKAPVECRLFGRSCTPEDPVGPCMVSSEGTCASFYKYETRL